MLWTSSSISSTVSIKLINLLFAGQHSLKEVSPAHILDRRTSCLEEVVRRIEAGASLLEATSDPVRDLMLAVQPDLAFVALHSDHQRELALSNHIDPGRVPQ